MKIGTENKTKTALAIGLALIALLMVYRAFRGDEETPAPQTTANSSSAAFPSSTANSQARRPANTRPKAGPPVAQSLDPTLRTDLLKSSEDVNYEGSGRDIFRSQAEPAPIPKVIKNPVAEKQTPPPPPPPPPINLKFYGFANKKGGADKRVFLSSGEDIFVAQEGQIVNRRYKILKVNPTSIDVEDVLTNNRQTIPLTAS